MSGQVDLASSIESSTEKTTEKILITITTDPYILQSEIAKVYGNTEDGIYWNIKKLKEAGIIRRIGPNKGGHCEVIDNDINE